MLLGSYGIESILLSLSAQKKKNHFKDEKDDNDNVEL